MCARRVTAVSEAPAWSSYQVIPNQNLHTWDMYRPRTKLWPHSCHTKQYNLLTNGSDLGRACRAGLTLIPGRTMCDCAICFPPLPTPNPVTSACTSPGPTDIPAHYAGSRHTIPPNWLARRPRDTLDCGNPNSILVLDNMLQICLHMHAYTMEVTRGSQLVGMPRAQ